MKSQITNLKALIIASLLVLAFSMNTKAQKSINETFTSSNVERWYLGSIPENPVTPLRLVILFSGIGENANEMTRRNFDEYLGNNTMVVIPQPWNWMDGFSRTDSIDDFQMVEDMITDVESKYNIDTADICIGGYSNGAAFSYNLICDFNSLNSTRAYSFRALAVVAGFVDTNYFENCSTVKEVPLIAFHGTNDQVANYNGGTHSFFTDMELDSVETHMSLWATKINGCGSDTIVTVLPDLEKENMAPSTAELVEYGCESSARTTLYRIVGGSHTWPSGESFADFTGVANKDIDASDLIAEFFENTKILPTSSAEVKAQETSIYPNPVIDQIHITSSNIIERVEIVSLGGNSILRVEHPEQTINVKELAKGMYLIKISTASGVEVKRVIKE